jgi:hypothetical protein
MWETLWSAVYNLWAVDIMDKGNKFIHRLKNKKYVLVQFVI